MTKYHQFTFPGDDSPPASVPQPVVAELRAYIADSEGQIEAAFDCLRTEEQALAHCSRLGVTVTQTRTQSTDHHQSPKALVGSVTFTAVEFCRLAGLAVDPNPQNRCAWNVKGQLHVTARRLDGAIPYLLNPRIVWEIKEYWGKTSGGSKMSDAVYECQLVGRELRAFEEKTGLCVTHVVFIDGLEQWRTRRSDFARFVDLANQGLIDSLIVGRQVEEEWMALLSGTLG